MEIFKADEDFRFNAVIDYWTSVGVHHAEGFKRAVQFLLEYLLQDNFYRDILILPILALFRHYLELRFKEIIVSGSQLLGSSTDWPWGHDLQELWGKCRQICENVIGSDISDRLCFIEKCVDEFVTLDPRCENFRYPLDGSGKPPFQHLVIGIKNLAV